ncbi:2-C-methyl-D-erythritol 4-phosphate cytidylyltransferase [Psychromonas antarctica]|uniref:2-C-methyl-D-erythritol 4-phosphate cytidylyltransferase n=1 Tax=Psychromonas antarctica TaxID=67573 RepID=UPI001EE83FAB|nr:2-C-methyl-D-erythritol 4-phosphate cytidylyltransferase [Psychromonas antarctica]MCG6200392.1 2-C-methyl-D-erythritol 4-phosphate cytidylyltransferase [Psychromonas antarctica]
MSKLNLVAVIAAAGLGKRVAAEIPKQYLSLLGKTIIEHSMAPFLNHPDITKVVISIAKNDRWFTQLSVAKHPKVELVEGGLTRVDSVLSALNVIDECAYVLVHDAARPCISRTDIDKLIASVTFSKQGAILASRVRDTMKRSDLRGQIIATVDRENLWHALTPQMFENKVLLKAISQIDDPQMITDEASAMEMSGLPVTIIEGRSDNLKVTRQEDLQLAELYLSQKINGA